MQYKSELEMHVKNTVWMMGDDYYTFQDLLDKLVEQNITANQQYVSKTLDEMLYYSQVKRFGIYFKNQPML